MCSCHGRPPDQASFSYLLGLYLGDGWAAKHGRRTQLRFTLDDRYPGIIEAATDAIQRAAPSDQVRQRPGSRGRRTVVHCSAAHWLLAFPQAGPGPKHTRPIVLADWQREIVDAYPEQFVRGLIHSDGCRVVNRFSTRLPSGRVAEYEYPRYFFSNLSADIRGLFCTYCERLGVRCTLSNHRNVSVSYRHSVAILDGFIGPKA